MKELLEKRKVLKRKKPSFIRQDAHKKSKLSKNWRKSRGLQSKMRLKKRGYRRTISNGWKSPAAVRGLLPNGLEPVLVANVTQLKEVNPKTQAAEIVSSVGLKNKLLILQEALNLNITIANVKDSKSFIEEKQKELKDKKAAKEQVKKARESKKEAKAAEKKKEDKKAEKAEAKEETAEEDKKAEKKKEQDKVLMHKS